jgi:hypothetical protein
MKFTEFVENHQKLMPKVKHEMDIGNPAIRILTRDWNTMAMMFPEKCDDVVIWNEDEQVPRLVPNPYRTKKNSKKELSYEQKE